MIRHTGEGMMWAAAGFGIACVVVLLPAWLWPDGEAIVPIVEQAVDTEAVPRAGLAPGTESRRRHDQNTADRTATRQAENHTHGHKEQRSSPQLCLSLSDTAWDDPADRQRQAIACRPEQVHSLGHRPTLLSGRGSFTIATWCRLDPLPKGAGQSAATPYRAILSRQQGESEDDDFLFGVRLSEQAEFAFIFHSLDGRHVRVIGGRSRIDAWQHVAISRDADGFHLFVDGRLVKQHATDEPLLAGSNPLVLGANRNQDGFDHHLHGAIAGLSVWDAALAPDHLRQLAHRQLQTDVPDPDH